MGSALVASCGEADSLLFPPAADVALEATPSADGTVGEPITTPPAVIVLDSRGNPTPGVLVRFRIEGGGGSVSPDSVRTNEKGEARVLNWTLGERVGVNILVADVSGLEPTQFEAVAAPGPPAQLKLEDVKSAQPRAGETISEPMTVLVQDRFGNPVPDVPVQITPAERSGNIEPNSGTTDETGRLIVESWTVGTVAGLQSLTVAVSGIAPVSHAVTVLPGPPANVEKSGGDQQTAKPGQPLADSIRVVVSDQYGNLTPGATVTFAPEAGSGTVSPTIGTTDTEGAASSQWTLGATIGTQRLSAVIESGAVASFSATAFDDTPPPTSSDFHIDLRYMTSMTATQTQAFEAAVNRWRTLVTGDLPPIQMNLSTGDCGAGSPALSEVVDDLLIFVEVVSIDGPGGTLGSAGPCWVRTQGLFPIVGRMRFDSSDLFMLETDGLLEAVILHEMGHVLGIGSLWNNKGFLQNPSLPSNIGADTHFNGAQAVAAFDRIGGTAYSGAKVPVENLFGGAGTRDAHWRESVLDNELMTGYVNNGSNPLSEVTVASLADMGYQVNISAADAFSLFPALLPRDEGDGDAIHMKDDILSIPLRVVDEVGREVILNTP